jgi:hypothetical protein
MPSLYGWPRSPWTNIDEKRNADECGVTYAGHEAASKGWPYLTDISCG